MPGRLSIESVNEDQMLARENCYFFVGGTGDNQLEGFELSISQIAGGTEETDVPTPAPDNGIYTFNFPLPRNVTEITIRRPLSNIIVLCEVQAFAGIVVLLFYYSPKTENIEVRGLEFSVPSGPLYTVICLRNIPLKFSLSRLLKVKHLS